VVPEVTVQLVREVLINGDSANKDRGEGKSFLKPLSPLLQLRLKVWGHVDVEHHDLVVASEFETGLAMELKSCGKGLADLLGNIRLCRCFLFSRGDEGMVGRSRKGEGGDLKRGVER
jgi:hypothetical protein